MKKLIVLFIALSMLFAVTSLTYGLDSVGCLPYDGFGARADAMGGAFTAVADDGFAPYWNPAGITQLKIIAITTDFGLIPDPTYNLDPTFKLFGGVTTQSLAVNVYTKKYSWKTSDNIFIDQSRLDYTITIAAPLIGKWLAVGGNFKYITTSFHEYYMNVVPKQRIGIVYDLGILIKPVDCLSIGLVGRDLNMTDIEGAISGTVINVCDSYVFGLAYRPFKSSIFAADFEIVNNNEILHLGLEQTILWDSIAFRAGVIKPLTDEKVPARISIGAGLKIFGVYINGALLDLANRDRTYMELSMGFKY